MRSSSVGDLLLGGFSCSSPSADVEEEEEDEDKEEEEEEAADVLPFARKNRGATFVTMLLVHDVPAIPCVISNKLS